MKFMMIVKATKNCERGTPPKPELLEAMVRYNEELVKAGILLAADGLHPSTNAIRISYPVMGGKPVIMDGPFSAATDIIAGYTLIEAVSREEAIEWAMRMPDPHGLGEGQIEIRQVLEVHELTDSPQLLQEHNVLNDALKSLSRS
ncbi:YciI family protein [Paenibacillus sp. GCM10027627]|uniref:YciI family protein n=1 Tax=unclassified Paenibacillus TaxID=185978 RepID=UPI0036415E55